MKLKSECLPTPPWDGLRATAPGLWAVMSLFVLRPPAVRREEATGPRWQQWLCRPHQPPGPGAAEPFPCGDPHRGPGARLRPPPGNGRRDWSRCWVGATTPVFSFGESETLVSSRRRFWQAPRNLFGWVLQASQVVQWQRIHLPCRRPRFDSWVGKIPWRRDWLPIPVFLPGESPQTEELGRLQTTGSQTFEHDWATEHM